MYCSRRNDARLAALAAGGLSPLAAACLRRHLAGCAECRTHYEQSRETWAGLRGMASAPISQALANRVRGAWPPAPMQRTNPMKRRMALLTCALLLVGVSAAMAAHVIGYHPSGGFGHGGQTWNFTTNLKGRMTVLDPQGQKIGQFTNDGAWMTDAAGPASAWVRMTVAGQEHVLRGPGRSAVRDSNGVLLGYVVFSDVSEADMYRGMGWPRAPRDFAEAAQWAEGEDPAAGGGASGVATSFTGARGFDKALGVSWKMRGYGTVQVTRANGDMAAETTAAPPAQSVRALLPPGFLPDPAGPPEFLLTAPGKTVRETGYGRHVLRDGGGKTLLVLTAAPR